MRLRWTITRPATRFVSVGLLALGAFLGVGCGGSGGKGGSVSSNAIHYKLATNSASSAFASAKLEDGATVTFLGTRDGSNKPQTVTDVICVAPDGGTSKLKLDDSGHLQNFVGPEGTQVVFDWTSATGGSLTMKSKDGQHQLKTSFDGTGGSSAMAQAVHTTLPREGSATMEARYGNFSETGGKQPMTSSGGVTVQVLQCGMPSQGSESVYVTAEADGKLYGPYPGISTGSGMYQAAVPNNLAPTFNPMDICNETATALSAACYLYNSNPLLPTVVCNTISAAIAASSGGLGTYVAVEFDAACNAMSVAIAEMCTAVNIGPDPSPNPSSPNLASLLCSSPILDQTLTGPVTLRASVDALPSPVYSLPQTVSDGQTYPTLTVDLGSSTVIRSLNLDPSAPVAHQGYLATADIFCLPAGTTVKMSIVGTDGYSNSQTTTVSSTQTNGTFTLSVPGAGTAGIQDTVTVLVTLPDGTTQQLQASLVFQ